MKELPVGFIDSGYGGLTVVKQSLKQLPNESIIYLGDNHRAPYGPRPLAEVRQYIWQMADFLIKKGIKMLVIACNTGTAAALDDLRLQLDIPVVGVIHSGSRSAIKLTHNNKIGVIGTQGTIQSQMYEQVMHEKNDQLEIYSQACPEFVMIVEEDLIDQPETDKIIAQRLSSLKEDNIDCLVLGCTHYPLLYSKIKAEMGPQVILIDSGVETINEVSMVLDYFNLSRSAKEAQENPATIELCTTGKVEIFKQFAVKWLKYSELSVNKVNIEGDILVEHHHR